LSSLDKKIIDFEGSNISEALGQIDIEMNQHSFKKSKEENLAAIQEMSQVDLLKINKWLGNPSLQFQDTYSRSEKDPRKDSLGRKEIIHFQGK
jgi:hypothetical protein